MTQVAEPWRLPFDGQASADDILNCFRIILGRRPHEEEWAGHRGHIGSALHEVVCIYLNSLEFADRGLMTAAQRAQASEGRAPDIQMADLGDYKMFADRNDNAVGRHALAGAYDTYLTDLMRRFLQPGMGMLDIGANIGVFALLAAAKAGPAGYVLAVEPNPANTKLLEASRRLNGFAQLVVCQAAAASSIGLLGLYAANSNGTTSSIDETAELLADAHTVAALRVDDLVPPDQRIDFIKIDVEGAEFNALRGTERILRRTRPVILSEFSPALLPRLSGIDGIAYLEWLMGLGYEIGVVSRHAVAAPGMRPAEIMAAYEASGSDHIDLVCLPPGAELGFLG